MHKRFIALCVALMSVAAVVPAMASATPPTLRDAAGTVKVGAAILATNVGNTTLVAKNGTTTVGTVTCTSSKITADVTKNNDTAGVQATITTAEFTGAEAGGKCANTIPFAGPAAVDVEKLHYCLTSTAFGTATLAGGACGGAANVLTFQLTTALVNCKYEAANIVAAYKKEDPAGAPVEATHLTFTNQEFKREAGQSGACPEKGFFTATYKLETESNGEPITAIES